MFEELGANLYKPEPKVTLDEVNILHVPIFVTLDACHLLKLARNCFGDFKVITNEKNEQISWRFLEELNKIQQEQGLHLATKIRSKHIRYQDNKMKVSLAAQLFSKSVSKALLFCENDLKLAELCSFFNDLFDVCNTRSKSNKLTISQESFLSFLSFIEHAKHYICNLKQLDGKLLIEGPRKKTFLGFLVTLKSFMYIYRCYVQTHHLSHIVTFKSLSFSTFFKNFVADGGGDRVAAERPFRTLSILPTSYV